MHILSEFTVLSLQHLQPFLLCLCSCNLVSPAVFDILSPVGVGRQGKGLVLKCDWKLLFKAEYLFIVKGDTLVPDPSNLPVLSNSILLFRLFSFSTNELFHELRLHFPNGSLEVVRWLLLLPH